MRTARHSILDLAPLELHCMNALWALGEASVRDIRDSLASSLPRAYTTIMTIMDRLAHKGVVERRKVGRAYVYRPSLSAEAARAHAVEQVVEHFFGGSAPALQAHLTGAPVPPPQPRGEAALPAESRVPRAPHRVKAPVKKESSADELPAPPMDEVLL